MATQNKVPVKFQIDIETTKQTLLDLYGLKAIRISELNGYYDKNFHVIVDDDASNNIYIDKVLKDGYVLKIINALESKDQQGFEAQTKLTQFLNKNNIRCPQAIPTKDNKFFDTLILPSGIHIVKLLEFIPGNILFKLENPSVEIFFQVGILVANLNNVLDNFDHAAYHKTVQWCLGAAPDILSCVHVIGEKKQTLVKSIIAEFSSRVLTAEDALVQGIIHGDINEQNLIVETISGKTALKALIDFGDTHHCCYLYELAIAVTYMIFLSNNVNYGGHALAGYLSQREIPEEEFKLLKICVMARFCQSLVLGAYASLQDPGNDYVLTTAEKGWGLLEQLSNESEEAVLGRWKSIINQSKN